MMKNSSEKKSVKPTREDKNRRIKNALEKFAPGLRLTPRDASILMAIYRFRALTTPQVEALFFRADRREHQEGPKDKINTRCQYRLQLLYQHGYLMRDEQPQKLTEGRKPFVYWLDKRGAEVMAEHLDGQDIDWAPIGHKVSPFFLEHLLATNDVRVALTIDARKHNFTIAEWLDDRTLKRQQMTDTVTLRGPNGRTQRAAVVPDGYFVLDTGAHLYHHFFEMDLSTVTGVASVWGRRDWARKVAAYLEYYRSGKYQERYKTQGLRILTITTGDKRLANLKTVTEKAGGKARFWFTTLEHVRTSDVFTDPIWRKAGDSGFHTLIW